MENNVENIGENSVVKINNDIVTQKGEEILETNKFFNDLDDLMQNTTFRNFYNEYFKDWSDIQVMIFYMKLYAAIEAEYKNRSGEQISRGAIVFVMHKIMSNTDTRKAALSMFKNFKENIDISQLRPMLEFNDKLQINSSV